MDTLFKPTTRPAPATVGTLLREWRQRRRMSQLDLAGIADVSTRHLSFVESGRSMPSRDMLIRLAEQLDVPLRERNTLFVAAGYAPLYRERALADPQLDAARRAVDLVLKGHEPYPALAVDRHWTMIAANAALGPLVASADASLLAPPVNVLRLSMHPLGLASVIDNWHEWRAHLLARVRRQVEVSGDATLAALMKELEAYPAPPHAGNALHGEPDAVIVPLRLRTAHGVLSFFSTTTVFGTPVDITLSELAIEAFFPADDATAATLRELAAARR
ncbi:XRE family transcriptional regulator [Caballeronia concitans]|uniref:XRE family transcriptional regulator n=1 Tax=Caballeronia concitans TaxID=1777133 RepID=A0A658QVY8_9BURK|nr:helix-turn-helix transcriptional regulator [Caballeronia concitans]KIG03622.1 transcriptional regulator, XRE family [Burkholderia sp. MR1]SAL27162.1 XRE family transcriptional regulator [Caballeronia concitans]